MHKKINIPWPVAVSALFVFIFTNLFSFFIFNHIPRVHDEIDYLFQAKIFKSGRLCVPSPCAKESFDFPHMINNGQWYSQYTPGYPSLLLLGLLIQAPWIINPLLAALSIILFYFLGKEIFNSKVGVLAAVLGAVSIWFLLMSSTMMSHTSSLFFTSFFLLFMFRSIKNPSITNGLLAGLGLGMAFLIRPYNAFLISLPFLLYYAVKIVPDLKKNLKNAAAFILIILFFLSVLLVYNQMTNGHPLRMGYLVAYGKQHGLGFGRTGYTDIPLTPTLGTIRIGASLGALNKYLFGWPLSSFLALLPLLWMAKANKENKKKDMLLAAGFFSMLVGLYFYWGVHVFIGARMFFEVVVIFLLLSAHGISELPALLSRQFRKLNQLRAKKITAGVLIILVAYAFLIRFPAWVRPSDNEWYYKGFAHNFAGVTPKIQHTLKSIPLERSLVIMKLLYHPFEYFPDGWWSSGFLYDDPFLKANIIYANDKGQNNIKLFKCFPERKIYLYLGTLEKGMLIPLEKEGDNILGEKPIALTKSGKKYIELIDNPKEFFKVYSSDFGNFLDEVYKRNNPFDIDVSRLTKLGLVAKNNRSYKQAAFYFEAALQIEKQPEIRYRLLSQLSACYIKTGKAAEARIVEDKIHDYEKGKFFNVMPEKGF
jgi:hypothetical protein